MRLRDVQVASACGSRGAASSAALRESCQAVIDIIDPVLPTDTFGDAALIELAGMAADDPNSGVAVLARKCKLLEGVDLQPLSHFFRRACSVRRSNVPMPCTLVCPVRQLCARLLGTEHAPSVVVWRFACVARARL
jgi:hypothetical protein